MINGMSNKTILITGATDGLGKQTALQLAKLGARIFLHGRNPIKAENVRAEIIGQTGNCAIDVLTADFQSLRQVREMVTTIKQRTPHLDILINNAGVYMHERRLSEDGYEMTFAVNHLAPFLLTNLLLELLKQSAPSQVITLSSVGHKLVTLNMADLQGKHFFWGWVAYCRSKLLNVLFTFELAERLKGSGVNANAIHPGVVRATNLTRKAKVGWGITVNEGAESIVNLATSSALAKVSGAYFNRLKQGKASPIARKIALRKQVWQISSELTSLQQV
jgi:NAD(P)-dependent dehydrogenase (short-subunit alcohol dehydrogenase family)